MPASSRRSPSPGDGAPNITIAATRYSSEDAGKPGGLHLCHGRVLTPVWTTPGRPEKSEGAGGTTEGDGAAPEGEGGEGKGSSITYMYPSLNLQTEKDSEENFHHFTINVIFTL